MQNFWKGMGIIEQTYYKSLTKLCQSSDAAFKKYPWVLQFYFQENRDEIGYFFLYLYLYLSCFNLSLKLSFFFFKTKSTLKHAWNTTKKEIESIGKLHLQLHDQIENQICGPLLSYVNSESESKRVISFFLFFSFLYFFFSFPFFFFLFSFKLRERK